MRMALGATARDVVSSAVTVAPPGWHRFGGRWRPGRGSGGCPDFDAARPQIGSIVEVFDPVAYAASLLAIVGVRGGRVSSRFARRPLDPIDDAQNGLRPRHGAALQTLV